MDLGFAAQPSLCCNGQGILALARPLNGRNELGPSPANSSSTTGGERAGPQGGLPLPQTPRSPQQRELGRKSGATTRPPLTPLLELHGGVEGIRTQPTRLQEARANMTAQWTNLLPPHYSATLPTSVHESDARPRQAHHAATPPYSEI